MGILDGIKGMAKTMMGGGGANQEQYIAAWNAFAAQYGWKVQRSLPRYPEGIQVVQEGQRTTMEGVVQGIEIFWEFIAYTYMKSGEANRYYWVNENLLSFKAGETGDWFAEIEPLTNKHTAEFTTGMEEFDALYATRTNDPDRFRSVFTKEILRDFVDRGWMHLVIGKGWLTVQDDFMNQFGKGLTAGPKMMAATHPLFGYAVTNPVPNVEISHRFVDVMVTVAKRSAAYKG